MKRKEKVINDKTKSKGKTKKPRKEKFLSSVKQEIKKVVWPSKKDVLKYTVATLIFCIIVMIFFQSLDLGLSVIKGAIS